MVSLSPRDAEGTEHRELLGGLDALGQQDCADRVGEPHQRGRQRVARRVGVDAVRELEVELEDVGAEMEDVLEARVAGTGIVDRDRARRGRGGRRARA